jgi:nicotinate-nucleotide adenylyltransferase
MERIGILGGTFDPPHIGHLWLGEAARQQLMLDKVLFLPAGEPPHKPDYKVTPADHRLEMTRLAISNNESFAVDDIDVRRPPPHYTFTLMKWLHQRSSDTLYWLLIGSDSLRDLPTWYKPDEIMKLTRLGVLPRSGVTIDWDSLTQTLPRVESAVDFVDAPTLELSSTEIRLWLESGKSLRYLVPQPVLQYIAIHKLYQD